MRGRFLTMDYRPLTINYRLTELSIVSPEFWPGICVKQVVDTVERITSKKVPHAIVGRSPGDPSKLVASFAKAKKVLGWQPKHGLEDIVTSAWNFEKTDSLRHSCKT